MKAFIYRSFECTGEDYTLPEILVYPRRKTQKDYNSLCVWFNLSGQLDKIEITPAECYLEVIN